MAIVRQFEPASVADHVNMNREIKNSSAKALDHLRDGVRGKHLARRKYLPAEF
jgi:hypothetical protein